MILKLCLIIVSVFTTSVSYLYAYKALPNITRDSKWNDLRYEWASHFPLAIDLYLIIILGNFVSDLEHLQKYGLQDDNLCLIYILIILYFINSVNEFFIGKKRKKTFPDLFRYDGHIVLLCSVAKTILIFLLFINPIKISGLEAICFVISIFVSVIMLYTMVGFSLIHQLNSNKKLIILCLCYDLVMFLLYLACYKFIPLNSTYKIVLLIEFIVYFVYMVCMTKIWKSLKPYLKRLKSEE